MIRYTIAVLFLVLIAACQSRTQTLPTLFPFPTLTHTENASVVAATSVATEPAPISSSFTEVAATSMLTEPATIEKSATPTALPTSYLPRGMRLLAPPDGAVLDSNMPQFEYERIANAWAYDVHIINLETEQEIVWRNSVGPPVNLDDFLVVTPSPLPDGSYEWSVCVSRYADAYCTTQRWTFIIDVPD